MNRLHVRIAVSEAAAWTARRFYGGRYRIVPNGVHLDGDSASGRETARSIGRSERPGEQASLASPPGRGFELSDAGEGVAPLRILFVGQAVERKGLPVLLRAFEALRDHVPGDAHARRRQRRGGRAHDPRRPRHPRARQGLRGAQAGRARARRRALRALAGRRELRHGPHRGPGRGHARARLRHPRLPRRPARRRRRAARAGRRPARARRGAARAGARTSSS